MNGNLPLVIEPLVVDRAWACGAHPIRRTLQLRESDISLAYALMHGSGAREGAFFRMIFQRGLAALIEDVTDGHA